MTTKNWCLHNDLGIYMGRHSTLNSYLLFILLAVCGRLGVRGGNLIPGMVMPLGFHADERSEKVWRTVVTGLPPAAAGSFPPTALPEEITCEHPQRLRAALVSAVNPLRSWPDTQALEAAFGKLDLLVVSDIVMSETARLAHYVLPCRTFYESWDTTFFPWTYPEVYLQLRRPLVTPPGECLEASQIVTRLADRLGLIPELPGALCEAAGGDRLSFGAQLMTLAAEVPEAMKIAPFVLAKTLGKVWDSAAKAGLWGLIMTAPKVFGQQAARAGFPAGIDQGDRIFQALVDRPEGLWVGKADVENPMGGIQTPSGKIELFIAVLEERLLTLTPQQEAEALRLPESFPLVLNAGRHLKFNANTLMRNPEWNAGKRACTIAMSPADVGALNLKDSQKVKLTTAAGMAFGELEVSDQVREGMVLVPHGFGLDYAGEVYGLNANQLTLHTHRDPIGTPLHRFVPCRVEAADL
jgi:anaerobic selenocysteine-containing dehydrogenase